ncbi:chromosome partitioning protein [Kaistia soli DSM 19436]|uniref:Chromosome partitioning protein n=1 Tax=Kaistia soli DSM 19436 TaxID=1122133 RepID=A0A1M4ZEC5_9HYPH|nr:ParA family partition ATPase [Kaistia soli]SHF16328.1 chromosome partitioning protein [Kaistia soli DSM 19436]
MTGKILVIAQQKGGSGKTTLAAHLAVAGLHVSGGGRVAILDIDPQGSLGQWYERRERRLGEGETGLLLRTASGWGAKREARILARDHDLVLIDMPPRSDMEARNAIEAADLVAVPVQPTPVDLWATVATLELVEKGGPPAILIVNRAPARAIAEATLAQLQKLPAPIAAGQLGNRVAFGATMGSGSTVLEAFPHSKAADEVRALAAELQRLLASQPAKAIR